MTPRVLLLGISGMLGEMVAAVLAAQSDIEVVGTARGDALPSAPFPLHRFDVRQDDAQRLVDEVRPDWIVNAIGLTKPKIDPARPGDVLAAMEVNARFPHLLADAASGRGARVIQIATDGVFSGRTGSYDESAPHDALDVYGKTKSLGEVSAPHVLHLRCSIIGPERRHGSSLLAWLLGQPQGARVTGYSDHRWNGITTWHFARICAGLIRAQPDLPSPLHVVPGDTVTKAELLTELALAFGRDDLTVEPGRSPEAVDATLATLHPAANADVWRAAGYERAPTVGEMVRELARHPSG